MKRGSGRQVWTEVIRECNALGLLPALGMLSRTCNARRLTVKCACKPMTSTEVLTGSGAGAPGHGPDAEQASDHGVLVAFSSSSLCRGGAALSLCPARGAEEAQLAGAWDGSRPFVCILFSKTLPAAPVVRAPVVAASVVSASSFLTMVVQSHLPRLRFGPSALPSVVLHKVLSSTSLSRWPLSD